MAFVCLLEFHLHFPEGGSLKGKRRELLSLKAQLARRFGASVAETDHHELWQRSTLTAAIVARDARGAEELADGAVRYVESQLPDGARVERALLSADEVLDGRAPGRNV